MKNLPADPGRLALAAALARSLRPRQVLLPWVLFASTILLYDPTLWYAASISVLLFITMHGIVCIQNDLADQATDRLNKRSDIPLVSGAVTKKQLLRMMATLAVLVVPLCIIIGYGVLPWVGLYLLAGWVYSGPFNFRSRPYLSAGVLAICYGAVPWLMSASISGLWSETFALATFVFTFGIITLKDYKDVTGDTMTGKRTLLVARGAGFVRRHILTFTTLAYIVLLFSVTAVALVITGIIVTGTNYLLLSKAVRPGATRADRKRYGHAARAIFVVFSIALFAIETAG